MTYENIKQYNILVFGDSNTFGFDTQNDGRFPLNIRYPKVLNTLLGENYYVIEEGLPGRTSVFDDPFTEGLKGLDFIRPIMMSHCPLDCLIIMLGTNDVKERFGCSAKIIAKGFERLIDYACHTPAWRNTPQILLIAPPPILENYQSLLFGEEMGSGCSEKSKRLRVFLQETAQLKNIHFLDAASVKGVKMNTLDGMHLTAEAHIKLAEKIATLFADGRIQ